MKKESIIIQNQSKSDLRLDKFLAQELSDFSRTYIQKLIADGRVSVDGIPEYTKAITVEPGMEVEVDVPPPREPELQPESIPLEIIFENDDCLVVNKPAGMVVHPSLGHDSGTLVQAVLGYAPEIEGVGGVRRPGLVHRLDQDTSGLILLAKNDRAHQFLQDQFRDRQVEKMYLALVEGRPPSSRGRVEAAIGRDPRHRQRMAVVPDGDGKMAVSEFFTEKEYPRHTLLRVSILTGRTHQIRVHMSFVGCPVVGDTVYGRSKPTLDIDRQFLHAHRLAITLPDDDHPRVFEAPLPEDLQNVLRDL